MKAIMVMFDSLNRRMLEPYGCDWTHTPNFQRLAERTATFDRAYVGSMPCMPARRELHTGRYNFLHRSWTPLEPFDDSMPELLKENGVYTHLVTDHQHYWEDGGATYHQRYSTFEFVRGQEGDPWKGYVNPPVDIPPNTRSKNDPNMKDTFWRQDWINRSYFPTPEDQPQTKTFGLGMDFIRANHEADNWFLQIETFDPHEPFFSHEEFKKLYPFGDYEPPDDLPFDWPSYKPVDEPDEYVQFMRYQYAALLSMCDTYMGKVLDLMDELNLWEDTMLIVCTDHGFLLGEHDWWAKNKQPWYNELANVPFFMWDPRSKVAGERRQSLVQMIDIPATLLEYFGVALPPDMQGRPLKDAVASDTGARTAGLFGIHGGHVNCTDGNYVYMRAPANDDNAPLFEYTLMPTRIRSRFSVDDLQNTELSEPFSFTKGCKLMKVPARAWSDVHPFTTLLYDLVNDPEQQQPIANDDVEERMISLMTALMKENDAPAEQFERLGLT
ncbi:MAG: sulfatase [Chloroflexota bacterium]